MDPYFRRLLRHKLWVICLIVILLVTYFVQAMVTTIVQKSREHATGILNPCNATQERRLRHLSQACRTMAESGNLKFVAPDLEEWRRRALTVVVLEKERSLFCFVPKVACSSWKTKLLTSRGVLKETEYTGEDAYFPNEAMQDVLAKHGLKSISSYKPQEADIMLKTFFKFMFVRHPLERLLSAYTSKLSGADGISKYYIKIASEIAHRNSSAHNKPNRLPTFEDFARYVSESRPAEYDLHWRRFADICNPCGVGYDFVGRLETMEEDVSCVLGHLGLGSWFPHPYQVRTSKDYQSLPSDLLTKLRNIYELDSKLFDYDL